LSSNHPSNLWLSSLTCSKGKAAMRTMETVPEPAIQVDPPMSGVTQSEPAP
jgi:hypothetical protein